MKAIPISFVTFNERKSLAEAIINFIKMRGRKIKGLSFLFACFNKFNLGNVSS